jgi:hypothetical protein
MIPVPVISNTGKPLMPCHPARARRLIRNNKALPRFKNGMFYIKLLEREDGKIQTIAVGIDPGSKKEAFTVKSEKHTYLNIQSDAVTHVKEVIETRRNMRRARRFRKTPCRKNRSNRAILSKCGRLPPSTCARWNVKLRIINILRKLYPIETYVVEDVKAISKKGDRRWNISFSPLEVGKNYFYNEIKKLGNLILVAGYETSKLRLAAGLNKTKNKLSEVFEAHCVDSWVLANSYVGGHVVPENKRMVYMTPLRFYRRQLHYLQPDKKGRRKNLGGTRSMGFTRGSLVKHSKYKICYIGGTSFRITKYKNKKYKNERISLHNIHTGHRITQCAKPKDCKFLAYLNFKIRIENLSTLTK